MAFGDFTVTRASTKNVLGSAGTYVSVANNVPAFEFNTDGSYRGLLVEPGATNQVRNNSMQGAVVGTPGTLPTNWTEGLNGLTREVVAVGSENGVEYIDLRFTGTATGTTVDIRFEGGTNITATPSQVWVASFWSKIVAQPTPPVDYRIRIVSNTSGGTFIADSIGVITPTSTLARQEFSSALSADATTARTFPGMRFTVINGNTYDFTIRIGWPQMETGSVATSPIVTTGSTASRVADVVSLTGASSLIGQAEGTLYAEIELPIQTPSIATCLFGINVDGATGILNAGIYFGLVPSVSNQPRFRVASAGSTTADIQMTAGRPAGIYKFAGAYASDDAAFYANGAQVGTDNTVTVGTNTEIYINFSPVTNRPQVAWIRSVALFPTRLDNTTLESITTL